MKAAAVLALAVLVSAGAAAQTPSPAAPKTPNTPTATDTKVNPDGAILADFKKRIDAYLETRKQAAKNAPPLKETKNPAEISAAEETLAANLRAVRAAAKPGDIFTPEIRDKFRRLLYPEMKGEDGRDAKQVMKDDAPLTVPLKVNAKYPETAALPTVPASLLASLPRLPEELEYRIVANKHLILRDTGADIIVDYIPNVIR